MAISPFSLQENYWDNFEFRDSDLEFIYDHLIEIETPQTTQELVQVLVNERIKNEKESLKSQQQLGSSIYLPKDHYSIGQQITFPALNWQKAKITNVRQGNNVDLPPFEVLDVVFDNGDKRQYASSLENHKLNQPVDFKLDDPKLDPNYVLSKYNSRLIDKLDLALRNNPDLVNIAWHWFPRTLLVDINIGYLNLAEALLDVNGGGPISTQAILEQLEIPTDVNSKLVEFSLNLALQEDDRFDEVGPSGEVLWFLRRLEPEFLQQPPVWLRYRDTGYDPSTILDYLKMIDQQVTDELENRDVPVSNRITISLLYPHWRAGALPLSARMQNFFPTAFESPRVLFTFVDGNSNQKFTGWVDRTTKHIFGLSEWYANQGVIPGSLIHIERGVSAGEVIIKIDRRRATRDWIRTVLIGSDGGIVFAMIKQLVSTTLDERMALFISDIKSLDQIWDQPGRKKHPFEQVVQNTMRELVKLSPQGHVHAQELYAAVNILYRCPPGLILKLLLESRWASHLGDLYFRLDDKSMERAIDD
jgi:hypothetical protein